MRSAALALAWHVWWRYRWGLAMCAAGWLVLAALGMFLPRGAWSPALPTDEPLFPVAIVVIGSFVAALLFVLYAFSYVVEAQLEAPEGAFPARLFLLPVTTPVLVAWPMLQGSVAAAVTWVVWTVAVLRPAGMQMPLGWPVLLTANLLAWLQAVVWWPFPLRFLRIVAAVLVLTFVGMMPLYCMVFEVPTAVWVAGLAALLLAAYGVAVAGVARTRRGDGTTWTWPSRLAQLLAAWLHRRRVSFSSPLQAQAWFEWRLRGKGFPFAVGLILVAWGLIVLTGVGEQWIDAVVFDNEGTGPLAAVNTALTAPGLLLGVLVAIVLLLAGVFGTDMVGGTRWVGQRPLAPACHPFLALRPLTDGELVLAKLRMAARAVLTSWALVLLAAFLCLGTSGKWRVLAATPLLQPYSGLEICAGLAAGLAGLVLLTWLNLVSGMWIALTGRPWLINTVMGASFIAWVLLGLLAYWLAGRPDLLRALVAALPSLAAWAVVVKLLLAVWLTRALCRRRLVGRRVVAVSAAALTVVATGTVIVLARLVPADLVSLPTLALGVVLALPVNRFAAAPLALEWNRHR
jgi:hypothetical protein